MKDSGTPRDPARSLEAGRAALAEGRWEAARASYETALSDAETPEALEGLSWAAWWLDDPDTVFEARERALRLYRKQGRPKAAARMAVWLAADQLDFRGAFAVAGGWLRRAARLLETVEPGPEHGWLAFHQGYRPEGTAAAFFELVGRYAPPPPPGASPPLRWGREDHVRELFGDRAASLRLERRSYVERSPGGPEEYRELFTSTFGPFIAIRSALASDPDRLAAFDREFHEFAARWNIGVPGGPAEYEYPYLLVLARKWGE